MCKLKVFFGFILWVGLGLPSCVHEDPEHPATNMPSTAEAQNLITYVQKTFVRTDVAGTSTSALGKSSAVGFMSDSTSITPVFPGHYQRRISTVAPIDASREFVVRDIASSFELQVSMAAAAPARAETAAGFLVYPAARGGADVIHRFSGDDYDEFVVFNAKPTVPEISYSITLPDGAGLRLVGGILEVVDAEGTPRVKLRRASLIGSDSTVLAAKTEVVGCGVDTSNAPPWGRSVTPPGNRKCQVRISWDDSSAAYPLLLDPSWSTALLTDCVLDFGQATGWFPPYVLATGGTAYLQTGPNFYTDVANSTCVDFFDPVTGTWAVTAWMNHARAYHSLSVGNGQAVVVGGNSQSCTWTRHSLNRYYWDCTEDTVGESTAETLTRNPNTGNYSWTQSTNAMSTRRGYHTGTFLPSVDKVLIAGGQNFPATLPVASCDFFDLTTSSFTTPPPAMTIPRKNHTANLLANGKQILLVGGDTTCVGTGCDTTTNSSEIYDVTTGAFTQTATHLQIAKSKHASVDLGNGNILTLGGANSITGVTTTADIFNGVQWSATGSLPAGRAGLAAALLSPSTVIAAGGRAANAAVKEADIYDIAAGSWHRTQDMSTVRQYFAATGLTTGGALVQGGFSTMLDCSTSEIITLSANGTACAYAVDCASGNCVSSVCVGANGDPCASGNQCLSGNCVDSVCCNSSCAGGCQACNVLYSASSNGVCTTTTGSGKADCGAYQCNGTALNCPITCSSDSDCIPGNRCVGSSCVAKLPLGAACSDGSQCITGTCISNACGCDSNSIACPSLGGCIPKKTGFVNPPLCCVDSDCSGGDQCQTTTCLQGACVFTPISCPPGTSCQASQTCTATPLTLTVAADLSTYPFSSDLLTEVVTFTASIHNATGAPAQSVSLTDNGNIFVKSITYTSGSTTTPLTAATNNVKFAEAPNSFQDAAAGSVAPGQVGNFGIVGVISLQGQAGGDWSRMIYTAPGSGTYKVIFSYQYKGSVSQVVKDVLTSNEVTFVAQ